MEAIYSRLKHLNILIVEDDTTTKKWLERVLSLYFKEVHSSIDAYEAMELCKINSYDIVITDIQIPGVDGLHLIEQIAIHSPKALRIVVTAFSNDTYLNRAVSAGIHLYLKKPIDIDELLVSVASNIPLLYHDIKNFDLGEGYIYNCDVHLLYRNEQLIKLTKKEQAILELLIVHRKRIVDLMMLESYVWNEPTTPDAIRMVIVGLRKKVPDGLIENFKGIGYRLRLS